MHYNIVQLKERWGSTGLLDKHTDPKEQIELSRLLDRAVEYLRQMQKEDDLHDNAGDIIINSLTEIYQCLTVRRFHHSEVDKKVLSENLKMIEHKINVEELIEIGNDIVESKHKSYDDFFKQVNFDTSLVNEIVVRYMVKYGTEE